MPSDNPQNRRWLLPLSLLALALFVRGGVLVAGWSRLDDDPDGYRQLAVNLVDHGTFGFAVVRDGERQVVPTAYRPPLYPLALAAVRLAGGVDSAAVAWLHLVLGVATVLLVFQLAIRLGSRRVAAGAAVLVTLDPILLNQSVLVMTETIATFLAAAAWWLLSRDRLIGRPIALFSAGLLMGIASLCRPTFLVWLALVAVVILVQSVKQRQWRGALAFCLAPLVVLAPWTLRNDRVLHRPTLTTTHGGYTLWLGNNDAFYQHLRDAPWGSVWDSAELDDQYNRKKDELGGDEVAADRWARQQAMQCIQRQPGMFVFASLVRVGRLWGLVPHRLSPDESSIRQIARLAVGVWYTVVFLFALRGAVCLRTRLLQTPWLWGLLLCVSFTAVHSVYWSNLRMRAPLMPVVCLAAAWGVVCLAKRWPRRAGC